MILKASGKIEVTRNRIACRVSDDFARYYRQLIYWEFPNLIGGLALAGHGTHITIGQPKLHQIDQKKANTFQGKIVEFYYDPATIYIGGFKNNFVGFYINIISKDLDRIRTEVMVKDTGDSYFHLSICNSKAFRNIKK